MINILFWLVKNRKKTNGTIPIWCRITINGQRTEIATGINIEAKYFDTKNKRVKPSHPLSEPYNTIINDMAFRLNRIYTTQQLTDEPVTAHSIKYLYHERTKPTNSLLHTIVKEYLAYYIALKKSQTQHKQYSRFAEIIKEFAKHTHIDSCNYDFYDRLVYHLHHEGKYSAKYIKKIIGFLSAVIRYANNNGYTLKQPPNYTVPFKDATEIVYLTEKETERISKLKTDNESIERVKDCFMVQCYTGLAYADLKKLRAKHIEIADDGIWININRKKVKTSKMLVPVMNNIKELLQKYEYKLPVISNQKYNKALKEIAKDANIHKRLTSHVGRKTFGTLLLNKGVPIETVSHLLGHADIRTTQKHYAKVLHMKVAKDVRALI